MDLAERVVDLGLGCHPEPSWTEMVDVIAIGRGCWDTPSRCVGLDGVALLFENRQIVAHCRRRNLQAGALDYGAGTDGLSGPYVFLDQSAQNL